MPEYMAEDTAFIAARLKEIEAEKQKAREKVATDDINAAIDKPTETNISDDSWMGY